MGLLDLLVNALDAIEEEKEQQELELEEDKERYNRQIKEECYFNGLTDEEAFQIINGDAELEDFINE